MCQTESPTLLLWDSSQHCNASSVLIGASGQPAFPKMHTPSYGCTDPPFVHSWDFTCPCGRPEFSWQTHLLRDGPKHCQGQKILTLSKRGSAVWFYVLHSAGQILVSLCHQQRLGQCSTPTRPEHRFVGGCTSPWATLSSLSGHRFLPLSGFYGRISPTSLKWCFLNKEHVFGISHAGFSQLHHHRSCHTAHPACLALVASPSWDFEEEKSVLASWDTRAESVLLTSGETLL